MRQKSTSPQPASISKYKKSRTDPVHAYTRGLLRSIPTLETPSKSILNTIPGMVASLADHTHGCRFCQRMGRNTGGTRERPQLTEASPGHWVEACSECYQP